MAYTPFAPVIALIWTDEPTVTVLVNEVSPEILKDFAPSDVFTTIVWPGVYSVIVPTVVDFVPSVVVVVVVVVDVCPTAIDTTSMNATIAMTMMSCWILEDFIVGDMGTLNCPPSFGLTLEG